MSKYDKGYFEPTRLIFARQLRGISRKKLSLAIGISRDHIRAFEQRDYSCLPALEVAEEIAIALNFPTDWFYQDEIEMKPSSYFHYSSGSAVLDAQVEQASLSKVKRESEN